MPSLRDYGDVIAKMMFKDSLPAHIRRIWDERGEKAAMQVYRGGLVEEELDDDYPKVEANEAYGRKRESEAAKAAREKGKASRALGWGRKAPPDRGR